MIFWLAVFISSQCQVCDRGYNWISAVNLCVIDCYDEYWVSATCTQDCHGDGTCTGCTGTYWTVDSIFPNPDNLCKIKCTGGGINQGWLYDGKECETACGGVNGSVDANHNCQVDCTGEKWYKEIECFYQPLNDSVVVDKINGGDCSPGNSCTSIQQVKNKHHYNTHMHLNPGEYTLEPPANLSTIDGRVSYFIVNGSGQGVSFINVTERDYEYFVVTGASVSYQVLFVGKKNSWFKMYDVTVNLNGVPAGNDTKLVFIRDSDVDKPDPFPTTVRFERCTFTGEKFPSHLFELSGGNLTLEDVTINSTKTNEIKDSIIYWNGEGLTHDGKWEFIRLNISHINYTNNNRSLIFEQFNSNPKCKLDISFTNCTFLDIKGGSSPLSKMKRSNDETPLVGFITTVRSDLRGAYSMNGAVFEDIMCGPLFAAPFVIHSLPDGGLSLDNLVFNKTNGSKAGGIFTQASVTIPNVEFIEAFNFDGIESGLSPGSGNITINLNGKECRVPACEVGSPECGTCLKDEKDPISPGTIAMIVVIVVAVVAVAAIAIVVALYFRSKKYSRMTEDAEDYGESSSSSKHPDDDDSK